MEKKRTLQIRILYFKILLQLYEVMSPSNDLILEINIKEVDFVRLVSKRLEDYIKDNFLLYFSTGKKQHRFCRRDTIIQVMKPI